MSIESFKLSSSHRAMLFVGTLDFTSDLRVELIEEIIRSRCIFLLNRLSELYLMMSADRLCPFLSGKSKLKILAWCVLFFESRSLFGFSSIEQLFM